MKLNMVSFERGTFPLQPEAQIFQKNLTFDLQPALKVKISQNQNEKRAQEKPY